MLLLHIKTNRFLLPSCLVFFTCLITVFAQEIPSQDAVEDELDLKALLAAIKHHDGLLKSGEGEVVYTDEQPPVEADTRIVTGRIAFDSENTRFDSQREITILTPTEMWQIAPHRQRHPKYHFSPEPRSLIHEGVDPRRWLIKDLATDLESENFQITGREVFNDILCYVLEAKHGDTSEKIWIAPEQGFRYLKRESQFPRPVDALDSDIPMEATTIIRTTISYQQFGETWFPKAVFSEYSWLDFKATYPIISRERLELKNFKVNHDLPLETFIVDIPDNEMIKVEGINKPLTKQEFLKRSQDPAEIELDFKALLAAIKQHDALLKSGKGEVVYTLGVPPFVDTDTDIIIGTIAFNKEKTRFDSEETPFYSHGKTTILTPKGRWEIVPHKNRKPNYSFNTEESPRLINPLHDVDPRRWLTLRSKDLATYLRTKNFQITGREGFKNSLCYVLEAKDGDSTEKIWIAPDQGFRYLKHESQFPRPVDALDSEVPMEALTVSQTTISYQQHGEVWFPKVVFDEYAWVDFKPQNPIISGQKLEIKNFKINHDIPPETFTVDIPDDAMIKVNREKQKLSKAEFLKRYGQQTDN